LSVLGSACWFMAMTLQNAAYVRALGQVELIFTILVSRFAFREPPTARELAGIALVAGGVVMLLTSR
jgi:drug/metabolite transporter (DMT)-like permease